MDYGIFNVRTDVNACNCTREHIDTLRESASKLTLGEKSLAASGNRTCVGGVPVRRSTNWATSPSLVEYLVTPGRSLLAERQRLCLGYSMPACWVFVFCFCMNASAHRATTTSRREHVVLILEVAQLQTRRIIDLLKCTCEWPLATLWQIDEFS